MLPRNMTQLSPMQLKTLPHLKSLYSSLGSHSFSSRVTLSFDYFVTYFCCGYMLLNNKPT